MSKEIIVERGTKTVYREGSKIIKQFKAGRAAWTPAARWWAAWNRARSWER